MTKPDTPRNRRILIVDDNKAIHDDFRKVLGCNGTKVTALDNAEAALSGGLPEEPADTQGFEINSAYQGAEGLEFVRKALHEGRPYAVAFVDVRMPPGWDGIETIGHLWQEDPDLQVVICTAYADYSWEQMVEKLGRTERVTILKKPFDSIEVQQLATASTEKWTLAQNAQSRLADLDRLVHDRTCELEQVNSELRKAHEETKQLLESISSILIGVNNDDRITQWNKTAEKVFGIRASDVLGRPFRECGVRWDWPAVLQYVSQCFKRGCAVRTQELRFTAGDKTERFLGATINHTRTSTGEPLGFLLVAADITDRKILESQLVQAQKLESIGQLAAGIAHEINTPTQFVGDNTRFLQEAFKDIQNVLVKYRQLHEASRAGSVTAELAADVEAAANEADVDYLMDEIPKAIEQSLEGVKRVANIVRSMKDFSHPGGQEKKEADLNKAIQSTITVARNEWKYVAEVETRFDSSLPPVFCLLGDFNQVILNMIINAAHAIAGLVGSNATNKGTIKVSTRLDGDWAEIRISDTGTGIPEEIRSRIFDPFFTTKEVGKGTGQGLAIAHSVVVDKHGGTIACESEVGRGTTFLIRLPIKGESAEEGGLVSYEEEYSVR